MLISNILEFLDVYSIITLFYMFSLILYKLLKNNGVHSAVIFKVYRLMLIVGGLNIIHKLLFQNTKHLIISICMIFVLFAIMIFIKIKMYLHIKYDLEKSVIDETSS